jgi:hypothetical protein
MPGGTAILLPPDSEAADSLSQLTGDVYRGAHFGASGVTLE